MTFSGDWTLIGLKLDCRIWCFLGATAYFWRTIVSRLYFAIKCYLVIVREKVYFKSQILVHEYWTILDHFMFQYSSMLGRSSIWDLKYTFSIVRCSCQFMHFQWKSFVGVEVGVCMCAAQVFKSTVGSTEQVFWLENRVKFSTFMLFRIPNLCYQ